MPKVDEELCDVLIVKLDSDDSEQNVPSSTCHEIVSFVEDENGFGYSESANKLNSKRKYEEDAASKKRNFHKENIKLKLQNEQLFNMRDKLSRLVKTDVISLLNYNKQHILTVDAILLDHLSDCMVFGALKKCPDCKNACPYFLNNLYVCPGHLTEWTKCQYETKFPEREKFVVPEEFKEEYEFLKSYKCVVKERFFPEADVEVNTSKKKLPLETFKIALIGELPNVSILEEHVMELGASISREVEKSVKLCISTKDEVKKQSDKIVEAFLNDIHVVSSDFVESVRMGSPVAFSIKEHLISSWGDDPVLKFGIKQEHQTQKYEEDKIAAAQYSVSITRKITECGVASNKNVAIAVEPESGLEHRCHVYQEKDNIYNVVLAFVDMSKGINSFYKLQLLESNKGSKYHLFRQWGRVGTGISSKKVQQFSGVESAITEFESVYEEKTLNKWWDRRHFVKKPGGMYPLDLDYGTEDSIKLNLKPGDKSKLSQSVQELICLIFDVEAMKKTMVEFEIDMKKMPLGKLSKKQIDLAYKVLCEAQQILVTGSNAAKITDVTNRFFTLIPHDFGMKKPPLLDHEEIIKSKLEMVNSLIEIEFAYNLIKSGHNDAKDIIDEHYEKLNTDIEVLEKDSKDYERIHTYLKNTHAPTHCFYSLELKEVYKINRHGESERYQKFAYLHNKKLLWHGSRLTNYVGILTQGLRIAPPEAPSSGYAFGKGIYFADMVTKSANYCQAVNTGLLLLCEVALGNMYEITSSENIKKLPKGKHSTLGMGQNIPDPKTKTEVCGVEIPYGKPVLSDKRSGILNYNEYIVYDVDQVNIKYLLKVDFKPNDQFCFC